MIQRLKPFLGHKKGYDIYEKNVSAFKEKKNKYVRLQGEKFNQKRKKGFEQEKG